MVYTYRFLRIRMYHKRALYRFVEKMTRPKKKRNKEPIFIRIPFRTEKNSRCLVLAKNRKNCYPPQDKILKALAKKLFKQHKRYLEPSLTRGIVRILLTIAHKGKYVVPLKQLASELPLISYNFR